MKKTSLDWVKYYTSALNHLEKTKQEFCFLDSGQIVDKNILKSLIIYYSKN